MSVARPAWVADVEQQITWKDPYPEVSAATSAIRTATRSSVSGSPPPVPEYGGAAVDPTVPVSEGGSFTPGAGTTTPANVSPARSLTWLWVGAGLVSAIGVGLVAWYAMQPRARRRRRR